MQLPTETLFLSRRSDVGGGGGFGRGGGPGGGPGGLGMLAIDISSFENRQSRCQKGSVCPDVVEFGRLNAHACVPQCG
jgi:hypothetical protein